MGRLIQAFATASSTKLTPLQAAVSTRGRPCVRKLIVEVLLLSGAALNAGEFELAEQGGNKKFIDTLKQWNHGGKAKGKHLRFAELEPQTGSAELMSSLPAATLASEFLQFGSHQAEERIFYEGLGVEDPEEANAEQQTAVAQDEDVELDSHDEDHLVKPDPSMLSRGPEPLDSTASPAPNADVDSSRNLSPSVDPTPSRPPSPLPSSLTASVSPTSTSP